MSYIKYLEQLNFSEKEIKIYVALIKFKKLTPTNLSKITKIKRATVYSTVKELIAKGVVVEDLGGKTLYLVALPPESLNNLAEKYRQDLKEKEKIINLAVKEISLLKSSQQYPVPKIRFIEEGDLKNFLYNESGKWNKDAERTDNTWWGFQDDGLIESHEAWLHWLWKKVHGTTEVKILTNKSELEKELGNLYPKRQIRFLDNTANFTATTWVVGDYLILISTQEHPYYLIEIHSEGISSNMREIFKTLWSKIK